MTACFPRNCHELAIEHIVQATKYASEGRHDAAEEGLKRAQTFAEMHAKKLKGQGQEKEANDYLAAIMNHSNRVRAMRSGTFSKAECHKDHSLLQKEGRCDVCGYFQKENPIKKKEKPKKLNKIEPAKREIMSTDRIKVGKPKEDPRYNYKPFHGLHPEDQKLAHYKFGGKDMASHAYPTDKETGRLAHAARAPITDMTRPTKESYKDILPHHREGSVVRVMGPHKEKLGIVKQPHPNFPGKIAVQIGHKDYHKIYVDPEHVVPSRPSSKIEKAFVTLINIRKAFLK